MGRLTNLRTLNFSCDGLKSLPSGLAITSCLMDLKILEIGGFWKELDSFPTFQVISQLETLSLWGWPKLKSLPEQIQHLTSLTHLYVQCFDEMEALPEWLRNLTSLKRLEIWSCKNMMYLPTLEAMQCLTKLNSIQIHDCPLLKERCNKESGSEWPKISHIPYILMGITGKNIIPEVLIFKDSVSGVKAGVAAGMPVVAFVIEETLRTQNCGKHLKRLRGRQSNNSCNLNWQSHISFSISVPVLLSHLDTPSGICYPIICSL
ncbi:unnamed protein product [Prunus brigantina]